MTIKGSLGMKPAGYKGKTWEHLHKFTNPKNPLYIYMYI